MQVAVRIAVPVGLVRWNDRERFSVVIKATYELASAGPAPLAPIQARLSIGAKNDQGYVELPNDFLPIKRACDLVLAGYARARRESARVRIGPFDGVIAPAQTEYPDGSCAPANQRVPFPTLPVAVAMETRGRRLDATLGAPAPAAAILSSSRGVLSPIQLVADTVVFDPVQALAAVTFRGAFDHAGDVDRDIMLVVDMTGRLASTPPRELKKWPQQAAIEPAHLEGADDPDDWSDDTTTAEDERPTRPPPPLVGRRTPARTVPMRTPAGTLPMRGGTERPPPPAPPPLASEPEPEDASELEALPTLTMTLDEATEVADDDIEVLSESMSDSATPMADPTTGLDPQTTLEISLGAELTNALPFELKALAQHPVAPKEQRSSLSYQTQPLVVADLFANIPESIVQALPFAPAPAAPAPLPRGDVSPSTPSPFPFQAPAPRPIPTAPPVATLASYQKQAQAERVDIAGARAKSDARTAAARKSTGPRIEGVTLEEFTTVRKELWSGAKPKEEVLKSYGLTPLKWRLVERGWVRQIHSVSEKANHPAAAELVASVRVVVEPAAESSPKPPDL